MKTLLKLNTEFRKIIAAFKNTIFKRYIDSYETISTFNEILVNIICIVRY